MSKRGFPPPKMAPCSRFCSSASSNRLSGTFTMSAWPMAVTTPVPPLLTSVSISWIIDPSIRPTVRIAFSAPRPQVMSTRGSAASVMLANVCVAPNSIACSRLYSTGSIAPNPPPLLAFVPAGLAPPPPLAPGGAPPPPRLDPNPADADHDHRVARTDVGGVDGRAPAGGDATTDECGLVQRDVILDLDGRRLVHRHVRGERAE